jgi:hypothetical protein
MVDIRRDAITVHYEIKEEAQAEPDSAGDGANNGGTETRIRRGEITAYGIGASPAILPPLYWGNGDLETDSSLLWLSARSFAELSDAGRCAIDLTYLGPLDTDAAAEAQAALDELLTATDQDDDAGFTLEAPVPVNYPCVVNGERMRLPAIYVRDSLSFAEYWVLDDSANPLVLKLTYTVSGDEQDDDMSYIRRGGGYAVTSIDFSPDWDKLH